MAVFLSNEVESVINARAAAMMDRIVNDETLDSQSIANAVEEIRTFRRLGAMIMADLHAIDAEFDEKHRAKSNDQG